jgi:hypothetical protein
MSVGAVNTLGQAVWPGPRQSGRVPLRYNLRELDAGCVVELEHTNNRARACKIARDHLREDPRYYSKLCSLWPNERGCEFVRRRLGAWPVVLMAAGLGIVTFAVWRNRKAA